VEVQNAGYSCGVVSIQDSERPRRVAECRLGAEFADAPVVVIERIGIAASESLDAADHCLGRSWCAD
jgi:hypothetical protein